MGGPLESVEDETHNGDSNRVGRWTPASIAGGAGYSSCIDQVAPGKQAYGSVSGSHREKPAIRREGHAAQVKFLPNESGDLLALLHIEEVKMEIAAGDDQDTVVRGK